MKKIALVVALGLALATSGCTTQTTTTTSADCVTVIVDFQSLKSEKISQCVKINGKMDAMTVFNAAGYAIQGTDKYGLQIICRVNGLPDAVHAIKSEKQKGYVEKCADMPSEFAYWALLIRTSNKDWTYAPVGIADLKVKPGEQVALVFSVDEKMVLPN
jgi:hypothetical protein